MTEEAPKERATPRAGKGTAPRAGAREGRPDRFSERTSMERYLVAAVPPADARPLVPQLEEDPARRVVLGLSGRGTPGPVPGGAVVAMGAGDTAMVAGIPGLGRA